MKTIKFVYWDSSVTGERKANIWNGNFGHFICAICKKEINYKYENMYEPLGSNLPWEEGYVCSEECLNMYILQNLS